MCVLILGEAPSAKQPNEVLRGRAGDQLFGVLGSWGFPRSSFELTNLVSHPLPDNRDPFPEEIETERLVQEIGRVGPELVVALGRLAAEWCLGRPVIMGDDYGLVYPWSGPGLPCRGLAPFVLVSYHPAAVLHSPVTYTLFWHGLRRLKGWLKGDKSLHEDPMPSPIYQNAPQRPQDALYGHREGPIGVDYPPNNSNAVQSHIDDIGYTLSHALQRDDTRTGREVEEISTRVQTEASSQDSRIQPRVSQEETRHLQSRPTETQRSNNKNLDGSKGHPLRRLREKVPETRNGLRSRSGGEEVLDRNRCLRGGSGNVEDRDRQMRSGVCELPQGANPPEKRVIGVDTEGTLESPLGASWSLVQGEGYWASVDRPGHPLGDIALHNALYDIPMLRQMGYSWERLDDTMLMAHVLGEPKVGLKWLAARHCGMTLPNYEDMIAPAQLRIAQDYLGRLLNTYTPKYQERLSEKTGRPLKPKLLAPSPMYRAVARCLQKANPYTAWQKQSEKIRQEAERLIGPMREATLEDV